MRLFSRANALSSCALHPSTRTVRPSRQHQTFHIHYTEHSFSLKLGTLGGLLAYSGHRSCTMAQTLYPRGTLKKIVKAHANRTLSKNVDILVYFLSTLAALPAVTQSLSSTVR